MKRLPFLITRRSRGRAAICGMVIVWLALVARLPHNFGNAVAAVGLVVEFSPYYLWAATKRERPRWGCFFYGPLTRFEITQEKNCEAAQYIAPLRSGKARQAAAELFVSISTQLAAAGGGSEVSPGRKLVGVDGESRPSIG